MDWYLSVNHLWNVSIHTHRDKNARLIWIFKLQTFYSFSSYKKEMCAMCAMSQSISRIRYIWKMSSSKFNFFYVVISMSLSLCLCVPLSVEIFLSHSFVVHANFLNPIRANHVCDYFFSKKKYLMMTISVEYWRMKAETNEKQKLAKSDHSDAYTWFMIWNANQIH